MTRVRLLALATLTTAGVLTAAPAVAAEPLTGPLGGNNPGTAPDTPGVGRLPLLSSLPLPLLGNSNGNGTGNGVDGLGL
ncbi:hypothetical protein NGB36_20410 [Streptomyces sp. RB6PN25]|uniref:Secreted protein n=1 Tax=Streptomyces humicola TaxID=2953240 RepID=A0ABT1Q0S4_9ACTN|nr:hypothetical protein [Streptomyces humicola]MCQ4082900.1 hypothetical protein [Streptomyces humicola]